MREIAPQQQLAAAWLIPASAGKPPHWCLLAVRLLLLLLFSGSGCLGQLCTPNHQPPNTRGRLLRQGSHFRHTHQCEHAFSAANGSAVPASVCACMRTCMQALPARPLASGCLCGMPADLPPCGALRVLQVNFDAERFVDYVTRADAFQQSIKTKLAQAGVQGRPSAAPLPWFDLQVRIKCGAAVKLLFSSAQRFFHSKHSAAFAPTQQACPVRAGRMLPVV